MPHLQPHSSNICKLPYHLILFSLRLVSVSSKSSLDYILDPVDCSGFLFSRIISLDLQFMILLVLRHTLPILIHGEGDYILTLYTVGLVLFFMTSLSLWRRPVVIWKKFNQHLTWFAVTDVQNTWDSVADPCHSPSILCFPLLLRIVRRKQVNVYTSCKTPYLNILRLNWLSTQVPQYNR